LAVSSFTDNEYERQFFETDKGKYETQYYNIGLLDELQSQLETMKDEQRQGKKAKVDHMEVIRTNLPQLTAFCGLKPYQGDDSYESLNIYLKQAEDILAKRGNQFTLKGDALVSDYIRHNGKDAFLQLKRDNYNTKLEDCVIGADQRRMLDVVDNYVVPRMYSIYLTPQSQIGRAPFYSSEKILGTWHIKTLWFNMGVLLLMCIVMVILLTKNIIINIINNSNFKLK
jgi:hypothetical protein